MTIESTGKLDGVKRWSGENPRVSRVVWIGLGLLILAGVVWLVYPKPQVGGRGFNNAPTSVGVANAVNGPIDIVLNELGTVTPLATATVKPQVSGLLTKIYFTEGQLVKVGDPLAQIDPRSFQASLDQVKASMAKDTATLANAKIDLGRDQSLAAAGAVTGQALAAQQTLVNTATATLAGDKANVENAEINLGYTRIVSPITGRAGLHQTDVGNIASSSSTIVVVTELDPISVLFTVPEDSVSQVTQQIAKGGTLTVDAYDRSMTNKLASGTVKTIDNVIDPTTGTVKMRAVFDNADGVLFPQQFVNIRLLVSTLQDQTLIPVTAIQRGSDGAYVFVVSTDKVVSQRAVKLGVQDGNNVAVTDGLKVGETVVVDGADRLRDGADVVIPNPKAKIGAVAGAPGGAATAQRAAQTQALLAACADDVKKFCAGQTGRDAQRCLGTNRASLSSTCTTAMSKLRGRGGRGGRGGGGGGGGGFP